MRSGNRDSIFRFHKEVNNGRTETFYGLLSVEWAKNKKSGKS